MLSRDNIDIKKLPKIDLHRHLDGSLRVESVIDEARKQGIDIGDYKDIESRLTAKEKEASLVDYLKCFDLPIKLMQTSQALERFTYEFFEDAYNDGLVYLELRFAPVLHTQKGLSLADVIGAVKRGMDRATEDYPIYGNIILCCMKNLSQDQAIETIEAGKKFIGKGVVGVDLAGPECEGFAHKFIDAMKLAKSYGYRITIHAGEAASGQNVADSIELLGAERIGHGVRIFDNSNAYGIVIDRGILLEICPTSNIQTSTVERMDAHPFIDYYKKGINVSFNTDNTRVSNTNLSKELSIVFDMLNLDKNGYKNLYVNAVKSSFASEAVKNKLLALI